MPRKAKKEETVEAEVQEAAPASEPEVETAAGEGSAGETKVPDYLRRRRVEIGVVVSDKMEKTVVVMVDRAKPHPLYRKIMRRSVKFRAHDELGASTGDRVRIIEMRPMSARKRWQVVQILQRAEKV